MGVRYLSIVGTLTRSSISQSEALLVDEVYRYSGRKRHLQFISTETTDNVRWSKLSTGLSLTSLAPQRNAFFFYVLCSFWIWAIKARHIFLSFTKFLPYIYTSLIGYSLLSSVLPLLNMSCEIKFSKESFIIRRPRNFNNFFLILSISHNFSIILKTS